MYIHRVLRKYDRRNELQFYSRDVSGFVRLFYILSKNKIFRIFGRHILDFRPIISRFSLIYHTFSVKNLFFVEIKNKRTKPDTSQESFVRVKAFPFSQSVSTNLFPHMQNRDHSNEVRCKIPGCNMISVDRREPSYVRPSSGRRCQARNLSLSTTMKSNRRT